MAIERTSKIVGYEVVDGVIFAKYKNELIENGNVIDTKIHRATFTQEAHDALKRQEFIDTNMLQISTEFSAATTERDSEVSKNVRLQAEKDALTVEVADLKRAK